MSCQALTGLKLSPQPTHGPTYPRHSPARGRRRGGDVIYHCISLLNNSVLIPRSSPILSLAIWTRSATRAELGEGCVHRRFRRAVRLSICLLLISLLLCS